MSEYIPSPINTDDIILDKEILQLCEIIAANNHDVWARGRIKQGWKYGKKRNDSLKETPCLVPYSQLPESEKDFDRNTAMEVLKLIIKLGYSVRRDKND